MSRWTNIALEIPDLREKIERHDFESAEKQCTEYISNSADSITDELIGVFILRAHCRAALGRKSDALNDHDTALSMIGPHPAGEHLFEVANDAMNAGLPLEHCAYIFRRAANHMIEHTELFSVNEEPSDLSSSPKVIASALNKEGICHYKAGSPIEQEIACYTDAGAIMDSIRTPDEDDMLMIALIKSNLAECHARNEDFVEATELYRAACEIYESRKDRSAVCTDQYAMCLRSLSDIYRASGDNITAHNYLSLTIQTLENHPDGASDNVLAQLSSCHNARGTLRFHMGDYDGEIEDCTAAIELRKHIPSDHFALATIYANRAEACERREDFSSAADDYRAAAAELEQIADEVPEARAFLAIRLYSLGEVCKLQELYKEAMTAYQKCAAQLLAIRSMEFHSFSREQLHDTEAYCRMWIAQLALNEPFNDYHIAMTETRRAIALFEDMEPSAAASMRISFLHSVLGEIYEMFDERESAAEEFRISQEILNEALANDCTDEDEEVDDEDSIWDDPSGTIPQA